MSKNGGPVPVIASLSWMPSRIALLLRESRPDKRFLRNSSQINSHLLKCAFKWLDPS
jgi:hypothetical protein